MPFSKGDSNINRKGRPKTDTKKTVWMLESLAEHGYDYERMLVTFLDKAAKGDKIAYDMAALLVKLVPHLANAPKHDAGQPMIETLVINRFEDRPKQHIETTLDNPLQSENH